MKTYAASKIPSAPTRSHATPVPNTLAHQEQYRQAMRRAGVQSRLEIGATNNLLEREADVVAERVLHMPKPELVHVAQQWGTNGSAPQGKRVQRKPRAKTSPEVIGAWDDNREQFKYVTRIVGNGIVWHVYHHEAFGNVYQPTGAAAENTSLVWGGDSVLAFWKVWFRYGEQLVPPRIIFKKVIGEEGSSIRVWRLAMFFW